MYLERGKIMETKQQYREPILDIIRFNEENVIRTSGEGVPWPGDWGGALDQLGF